MKFVWKGWYDAYDACYVPTLVNERGEVVWRGGSYYSGDLSEKDYKVREEVIRASERYGVQVETSGRPVDWDFEDQRKYSA